MDAPKNPLVNDLQLDPNGAAMWITHDQPLHIAVRAGEPFASVYINGVCIAKPGQLCPPLEWGVSGTVAAFDRALTLDEIEAMRSAATQEP